MTTTALRRRVEYLQQTSLSLALAAPSTSAALGAEAARLRAEVDLADGASSQRQSPHCSACGAVLIPGWSSTVSLEPSGRRSTRHVSKRRRKPASPSHSEAHRDNGQLPRGWGHSLNLVCLRCFRDVERKPLVKAGKGGEMGTHDAQNGHGHASQPSADTKSQRTAQNPMDPVAPTGVALAQGDSRKTARKRRKGGGLGSLLAQGQAKTHTDAKSDSLGLMDFLVAE